MSGQWIRNLAGVRALVEDPEDVAAWTRVRGWQLVDEPGPTDLIYIAHEEVGTGGPVPLEALDGDGWPGWKPGPPPELVDTTRDPEPVAEPKKQTKAAAGGSKSKE